MGAKQDVHSSHLDKRISEIICDIEGDHDLAQHGANSSAEPCTHHQCQCLLIGTLLIPNLHVMSRCWQPSLLGMIISMEQPWTHVHRVNLHWLMFADRCDQDPTMIQVAS